MTGEERQDWLRLIRAFKDEYPASRRTIVRRRRLRRDLDSIVWWTKSCNVIAISSRLDFSAAVDALVHEYAHVLDGHERFDSHDEQHSETWGVLYSKCYRLSRKVLYGEDDLAAAGGDSGSEAGAQR